MTIKNKRRKARPETQTNVVPLDTQSADTSAPVDIPAHVWATLQEAGEEAAQRLLELLRSPSFKSYAPTAQKALIELALTRAYGLPVRRSVNVDLSTEDSDAIAASLIDLREALPERQRQGRQGTTIDGLATPPPETN